MNANLSISRTRRTAQTVPPPPDPNLVAQLRLIRSRRVGPATFYRLLAEHGNAANALEYLPKVAQNAGVRDYASFSHAAALAELHQGQTLGFRLLSYTDPNYPPLLKHIPDAPPLLWSIGDLSPLLQPSVSIVGARNASSLGCRMTRKLAADLGAAGITVTSGLARGIDAAAHEATLETGTIGVQAGGLDVVYPRENAALHDQIPHHGLRLSEQPVGLVPQARHFPQRNRIIAGLSLATIVVEGAARSGSLITARDAADLGREVMAVPGNPMDARAAGCNMLIRDGATLIRSAEDVLDVLANLSPPEQHAPDQGTLPLPATSQSDAQVQTKILSLLSPTGVAEDIVIRDVGLPAAVVSEHLVALELDGKIHRHPGGLLALAS